MGYQLTLIFTPNRHQKLPPRYSAYRPYLQYYITQIGSHIKHTHLYKWRKSVTKIAEAHLPASAACGIRVVYRVDRCPADYGSTERRNFVKLLWDLRQNPSRQRLMNLWHTIKCILQRVSKSLHFVSAHNFDIITTLVMFTEYIIFMPPPATDKCGWSIMFSGCSSVSVSGYACVLLAHLTSQWTEFHQTLVEDTDELIRFWKSRGQGQGHREVKYLSELLRAEAHIDAWASKYHLV